MRFVPKTVLKRLYNRSSLRNSDGGVVFSIKNRLSPARLEALEHVRVDGEDIALERIRMSVDGHSPFAPSEIPSDEGLDFPLGTLLVLALDMEPLAEGEHRIELSFRASSFGTLSLSVTDTLQSGERSPETIPRDAENDYGEDIIAARQRFIQERTGADIDHIARYSFDPGTTRGNIEHFTGVAQIPLGIAGPLHVHGEHAEGEFYVPLATTEGTLVASYNRGMRVIRECGGVQCTVVGDNMQRAPVFAFENAAAARRFADWLKERTETLREVCAESDRFVSLKYVDYYLASRFCYTRFNFTTGDAAGMNMVGKATFAACNWILQNFDGAEVKDFYLESNFATDKKASMINSMRTRGKRVTAECTVKRAVLRDVMDADTEQLYTHSRIANIGSMLSGANNNGCHAANAITAIFIATGQDVANVAESSAGILHTELTEEKDLYISITLPSLIVGTIGGGTGLSTQSESLRMMDCEGPGKVMKFAEIVAGTVLAGEISLGAAISSLDWVSSHDQYGRNDPTRTQG
ncbi:MULTISPECIES: hydroxymethylglutaryl-CoA reductase [unclassified Wenzhouxiangella]|uniref:hydroxymethylglutaryl-CoA reductase n=1 Tax=unclassified Wenzhouxiangella TaxID=2613841 RepID=UPI000E326F1F|nr:MULTISPECIES: hydroxymethylglutaryl-CoA reductase [unclassified Wenzhouxiangella]RFF26734.1 hydroxymethylglutaryl-CoA reductase [Wenzhouxiangella sp. 15181]RFP69343.1 hydroxymethylglutaryl-CoA reductase [Wenzhouxiangella sp. 15190]